MKNYNYPLLVLVLATNACLAAPTAPAAKSSSSHTTTARTAPTTVRTAPSATRATPQVTAPRTTVTPKTTSATSRSGTGSPSVGTVAPRTTSVTSRSSTTTTSTARATAPAVYHYSQSTGTLYGVQGVGPIVVQGYSGRGTGLNNPTAQSMRNTGPIPQGTYNATAVTKSKGPNTVVLQPTSGTNTFGRDNFRIHGDNKKMNNTASHGCIIIEPTVRQSISKQVKSGSPVQIHVGR